MLNNKEILMEIEQMNIRMQHCGSADLMRIIQKNYKGFGV